jgi:hypothetical protein
MQQLRQLCTERGTLDRAEALACAEAFLRSEDLL